MHYTKTVWFSYVYFNEQEIHRGGIHILFFLFLHKNIWCGYSLEVPQRGTSKEYPHHMFSRRNTCKKDISIFRMKKAPYLLLWELVPLQNWLTASKSKGTCRNLMVTVRQSFHTGLYVSLKNILVVFVKGQLTSCRKGICKECTAEDPVDTL